MKKLFASVLGPKAGTVVVSAVVAGAVAGLGVIGADAAALVKTDAFGGLLVMAVAAIAKGLQKYIAETWGGE